MAADPLSALRAQVEDCIADPELEPEERKMRLSDLRDRLVDVAGVADRYLSSVEKLRESQASDAARDRLWARGIADLREQLIREGEDERELDEAGFFTHAELDRLEEEGLLLEAVGVMRKAWEETKHPRGQAGRFSHSDFFAEAGHETEGSFLAHKDRLRPTRTDSEEHIAKARRFAMEAAAGKRSKRKPLDVRENGDGTLSIVDGNSTYHALKDDLEHFRVKVGGAGETGDEAAVGRVVDELHRHAVEAEPQVTPTLKTVTSELGGKLEGLDQRLKSPESIRSKLLRKQEKYPGLTADKAGLKVMDTVRYTAIFPPSNYTDGVNRVLGSLDKQGFKAVDTRNYWGGGDDYDGYHAILQGPKGVKVELQFHTPDSFATKDQKNHKLFAQFRDSHDPNERYKLWQQMLQNTAAIEQPVGVEGLGARMTSPSQQQRQRRGEDQFAAGQRTE